MSTRQFRRWSLTADETLPYLSGHDGGPGHCTNCGAYSAIRHRLFVPALHYSECGSALHLVCTPCLSLTPHKPLV